MKYNQHSVINSIDKLNMSLTPIGKPRLGKFLRFSGKTMIGKLVHLFELLEEIFTKDMQVERDCAVLISLFMKHIRTDDRNQRHYLVLNREVLV